MTVLRGTVGCRPFVPELPLPPPCFSEKKNTVFSVGFVTELQILDWRNKLAAHVGSIQFRDGLRQAGYLPSPLNLDMASLLDRSSVAALIDYVDQNVRASGCDHSRRFTQAWSNERGVNFDDLVDALDAQGAYCDCEVVLNLTDEPLSTATRQLATEAENRWLLPPGYAPTGESTTTKIIVARAGFGKHTHAQDGEWLVPAPADVEPRKRMRKLTHFFIGIQTGQPAEVGVVTDVPAMSIGRFTQTVADSPVVELRGFDRRVAAYILGKISKLSLATTVGTDFLEKVGVASKHRELTIHRVILRR